MPKPPHKNHGSQEQPATQQQDNPSSHSTTIAAAQWLGPLPPPDALAKFNEIIPGGAERIFAMAEEEQRHRIEYEKTALNANVKEAKRGQILGATISILAVVGAIATATMGAHWSVSIALVGVPVLGIVRAIVNRAHNNS